MVGLRPGRMPLNSTPGYYAKTSAHLDMHSALREMKCFNCCYEIVADAADVNMTLVHDLVVIPHRTACTQVFHVLTTKLTVTLIYQYSHGRRTAYNNRPIVYRVLDHLTF